MLASILYAGIFFFNSILVQSKFKNTYIRSFTMNKLMTLHGYKGSSTYVNL